MIVLFSEAKNLREPFLFLADQRELFIFFLAD
jgi:hypothetical protein